MQSKVRLGTFRHEALLYSGFDGFLDGTTRFVRDALDAGEPILVVVGAPKIEALRAELGPDAAGVLFADMADVGRNPARIIPAWRDFLARHGRDGGSVRGVGEPIWAGRGPAELVECQRHESLLNLAFAADPAWWLLCPYDVEGLDPAVLHEAERTHPYLLSAGSHRRSRSYSGLGEARKPFDAPLPEPAVSPEELVFESGLLESVRGFVSRHAAAFGLGPGRTADLVIAVNELATNSILHGGGSGTLRLWRDGGFLVCEVEDAGRIREPLVGRVRPATDQEGGFGLWLVNQLCDLVQIRTYPSRSVVRAYTARR